MASKVSYQSSQHLMLLYSSDQARDDAAVDYINRALEEEQLAVYASVETKDSVHMERISSKITDYEKHVERGNLLIVRLQSFYKQVLVGSLEPFNDLKVILEEILQERIAGGKKGQAVVVADCADMLSRKEKFDECLFVERWWQNTNLNWLEKNVKIDVVCPHPSSVLEQEPFTLHKRQISRLHSHTVDAISR
jgi:hypothetical protein